MKVKLQNFSKSKQLLLLDVLDFLVDKGNMIIWSSISSKKFFQSLLDLLRTRDIPEVQMKLLGLIQKWGLNFEDKRSALPNFYSVYNKLRNSNVQFPNDFESNYQIYISNSNSNNYNKSNNYENKNDEYEDNNSDKEEGETFYYMESLKDKLKVPNFEHKYRRLVNFLVKMHDNIQMANLIMDSRERAGLKDIINTLREGNNTLIDTISGGRLKDEKLMEITLGTTEDINQTLNRNEDIKNGYKPKKFTSYFVLNNVIPIRNNNKNYRYQRSKSTLHKKSIQRRDEKYKNYDMNLNGYDSNKYKEKTSGPKNADDIFDLFSASNPSNETSYNNQPMNNFFSSQTQIRGNNNNNYPQLRNNPMNNIFTNSNNNRNSMMGNNNNNMLFNNNNFQGNNNNNNFGRQFNQNNNQQRPIMTNFDILEQKLNNLNLQQSNTFNLNSQSTQFSPGFNNNNMNNNNMNNNNNNNSNNNNSNLMNMLDQLGPISTGNSNQLVPYIGGFNQNNNNNNNNNSYMNNNNNNQFSNFNNSNSNNPQFNNFNINNINNFNNNNFNNNNNNYNQFNNNNSQNNNFGNNNNNNNGNMFNTQNNTNQMNFNTNVGISQNMNNNNNLGMSQNMNNNNFGMNQNNNQQMNLEEIEKQQKLKELDDLF